MTRRISTNEIASKSVYGRCELDSHADTTVAGSNCIILQYTGKECSVQPYSDVYNPTHHVPIVHAATAYQCQDTGQTYILVLNECLWMGDTMEQTLINPNQLRHYGTMVKDDPTSEYPMSITSPDHDISLPLKMDGTIVFLDSHTPTPHELDSCPKIFLSSSQPWDPKNVRFPKTNYSLQQKVSTGNRNISSFTQYIDDEHDENMENVTNIFSLSSINRRIFAMDTIQYKNPNDSSIDTPLEKPDIDSGLTDIPTIPTFQSSERHTDVSPEDLSDRWHISIAQAIDTLKNTTQRFLRSATLPLSRRYRADRVFDRKTLSGTWSTDTMDGRSKSILGNRYAQVFANKGYFAKIYPIDKKSKAGDALKLFCQEFGVPESLTFDGSKEQNGKNTQFMHQIKSHKIDHHVSEPDIKNQVLVEPVIGELRRRWFRTMIRKRVPPSLWDFGMTWVSEIMSRTYSSAGELTGAIPIQKITGETEDISEYLDFGFYDRVWYKDNAGLDPAQAGRWLGISSRIGRLMTYHILTSKGTVVSRSTVQRVTHLELQIDEIKSIFEELEKKIATKLKHEQGYLGDKPDPNDWSDLIEDDPDFKEEFYKVFNNNDIPQADDDTSPEILDDTYVNMELALARGDDGPQFARVTKRLRDAHGRPIGTANDNPILDTRLFEVEYLDGHKASLSANTIAENLFSQIDDEGNRFVLMESINDHRTNGNQIAKADSYVQSTNGGKRRKETTIGWEILIRWKDGSSTWEEMKDVKYTYPLQLAEYVHQQELICEPAFAWWVPFVLKKRNRMISKIKTKYWKRTHKYGIRIPKNVIEAKQLDDANGNRLWMTAIALEMKNIQIAFEQYDGDIQDLKGYQSIDCHLIFDIKLGENFRRKARMVAGGHMTTTPSSITYSSVVSRDSVRILLTIAALNDLDVLCSDIQNAYLTAPCREKVYTIAGSEFGPTDCGKIMLITRALYGLKSSGAAFRSYLADHLWDLGYRPSKADDDVWMRPAIKGDGFKYWEYILCYVDDILVISHQALRTMQNIGKKFKFKGDKIESPTQYLGAGLSKMVNDDGESCWAMSSDEYCGALVSTMEDVLNKKGLRLLSKVYTPLSYNYRPELDATAELKQDGVQFYQEVIGSLRWATEIGRVDILLEVALMSQQLALPREGHLEQVLHIIAYLKQNPKFRLMFDTKNPKVNENWFLTYDWQDFYRDVEEAIPPNMPEARGNLVTTSLFCDADLAGDRVNRRSMTGILIFLNRAPIHWYSKKQSTVESSTFGAEFVAMRTAIEMTESLRYKLRMFGVPIDGSTNVYCDNEAVYQNTVIPESTLKKKHHSIAYHRCREAVAAKTVRVAKQGTTKNLSDLFTKLLSAQRRKFILERFTY